MTRHAGVLRAATAAVLALILAVRLLSPAGFMPAFDHGSVAIVICPDAEPATAPVAHHHHNGESKLQQHCPYAAGAAPATAGDLALILAACLAAAALPVRRPFESLRRRQLRERPPLRGPPLAA